MHVWIYIPIISFVANMKNEQCPQPHRIPVDEATLHRVRRISERIKSGREETYDWEQVKAELGAAEESEEGRVAEGPSASSEND
jgi:hypothetical protein